MHEQSIFKQVPLVPVRDVIVFPGSIVPISVKRAKSVASLEEALAGNREIVLAMQKERDVEEPSEEDIFQVGTLVTINQVQKLTTGIINILVEGKKIVKITKIIESDQKFLVNVNEMESKFEVTPEVEDKIKHTVDLFKQAIILGKLVSTDAIRVTFDLADPLASLELILLNLDIKTNDRQKLLETSSLPAVLDRVDEILVNEISILQTARKIQDKTTEEINKNVREAYLREQLKAIERELGGEEKGEFFELEEKIRKAKMPPEVRTKAESELNRLKKMPTFSPESSYIRSYLEWLGDLPWEAKSKTKVDINEAEKVLDADHYGLNKVKERIIEFLAVQKLSGKIKGPILCFVGPPGVGKTSLGRSIAKALGRKFVKMSLGGMHDEAEIRGHRRTYVGALPGRIIQGIKNASTSNPVFMLDEIDKVGSDFRGDPSSALLEALDPEQNFAFSDHYLEVPYDLSDVMFITTANVLDTIPPALRDRMEVIEFAGYTEEEKLHIAKNYLIPKQITQNGLDGHKITVTDQAIKKVIASYTREAGVRSLEREIATICRKLARQVASNQKVKAKIEISDIDNYLGPEKILPWTQEIKDDIGISTGLAWTEAGGQVLMVEATGMAGKGALILTGHLGDVMKESVQAALSYAKSKAASLGISEAYFKNKDIHVHVPAGAIPKDGPSAGITMATALISAAAKKPVRRDVAMTGEITLRGKVLEIGGVKEKVLAAHRAGIKTIIIPKNNSKDLVDIPSETREDLKIILAETMDDVLKNAIIGYNSSEAKEVKEIPGALPA